MRTTLFTQESFSRFEYRTISDAARRLNAASSSTSPEPASESPTPEEEETHVKQHEQWGLLPEETIGRFAKFMSLRELTSLRYVSRHWRKAIDQSMRSARVVSTPELPMALLKRFIHLERLTIDHMDELHFCDIRHVDVITGLTYLSLQGMRLSNDSLVSISGCLSLVELSMTDVTLQKNCLEALQSLSRLTNLVKLCMKYIDVERVEYGGNYCIESIAQIPSIKHLEVRFDMSTEVLDKLSLLTQLEFLCLSSVTLHIPDLHFLKDLVQLRHLSLAWTHFAIYDAEQIDLLSNLTYLDLGATDVTDDSVKDFSRLTNLKHLSLKDDCIGDATVEHLSTMTHLLTLDLSHGAGLSDLCSLEHISTLCELRSLNLNGTHIGDSDLEKLMPLTNLERLDVGLTSVTDSGMEQLVELPNLQEINTETVRNFFDHL